MNLLFENLKNLFTLKYWFTLNPEPFLPVVLNILYVVFGLMIIAGLAAKIMSKKHADYPPTRKIFEKFYYLLASLGVAGLLLVFFRSVRAYLLGAPFLMLFWLIILLVWLYFVLRYVFIKVPKLKEEIEMKRELEKYLP
ncbi:MAG: hypothetical protein PHT40_03640 [Patescibacteria group bacterium]|nr:hypothetical protein [Patescibacteria group bacterium]